MLYDNYKILLHENSYFRNLKEIYNSFCYINEKSFLICQQNTCRVILATIMNPSLTSRDYTSHSSIISNQDVHVDPISINLLDSLPWKETK
jgi:hypothetical protein